MGGYLEIVQNAVKKGRDKLVNYKHFLFSKTTTVTKKNKQKTFRQSSFGKINALSKIICLLLDCF
jgi:hypothetical protein